MYTFNRSLGFYFFKVAQTKKIMLWFFSLVLHQMMKFNEK